jgi:hypothetical protein
MRKEKNSEYKVGYGKPPRRNQFPKGQSGNPKGRPRHSKNVATLAREALYAQVEVTENGRRRRVSKLEVGSSSWQTESPRVISSQSASCLPFPEFKGSWSNSPVLVH